MKKGDFPFSFDSFLVELTVVTNRRGLKWRMKNFK